MRSFKKSFILLVVLQNYNTSNAEVRQRMRVIYKITKKELFFFTLFLRFSSLFIVYYLYYQTIIFFYFTFPSFLNENVASKFPIFWAHCSKAVCTTSFKTTVFTKIVFAVLNRWRCIFVERLFLRKREQTIISHLQKKKWEWHWNK